MSQGGRKSLLIPFRRVQQQVLQERERGEVTNEDLMRAMLARPKFRAHCQDGERPCPFFTCRYHLAVEITSGGGLKLNHPEATLDELPDTCALDVADRGGVTREIVSKRLNVTREGVRQEEEKALLRFKKRIHGRGVLDVA